MSSASEISRFRVDPNMLCSCSRSVSEPSESCSVTTPVSSGQDPSSTAAGLHRDHSVPVGQFTKRPWAGCSSSRQRVEPFHISANNYEEKYPADAYGEEMGPNARVWRVYLDEAQKADAEMIDSWRDTTDALLVFAGLFSATVTTFVTFTSGTLQTDYTQVIASLLVEQIALTRATANGISADSIPSSPLSLTSPASPSHSDRWVNGLWFLSLSFSLSAAFTAVLVKQWTQHYVSSVSGTARDQVRVRQFRYIGVKGWHIPEIIAILPFLLHVALFLYLAGLVVLLAQLDIAIAALVGTVTLAAFAFYLLTHMIPIYHPDCPYQTPLSTLFILFLSKVTSIGGQAMKVALHRIGRQEPAWLSQAPVQNAKDEEAEAIESDADKIDADALSWLHSASSNPTVESVIFQSLAGLGLGFKEVPFLSSRFSSGWSNYATFASSASNRSPIELSAKAERIVRAYMQVGPRHELLALYPRWKLGFQALLSIDSSKAATLAYCCLPISSSTNPILHVEQYTFASKELHPFVWCRLLTRCLQQAKHPLADPPTSHAFCVLANFFLSLESRDMSDSMTLWGAKCAILFEYLHAILLRTPEERCRIAILACDFTKSLPRILTVLSFVVSNMATLSPEQSGHHKLLELLVSKFQELDGYVYEQDKQDQDGIWNAAIDLRHAVQTFVESNDFLQIVEVAADRAFLFEILFNRFFLACWPRLPPVIWTSALMKSCLSGGCLGGQYGAAASILTASFRESNLEVYRLFREHHGLSYVDFEDLDIQRYFWNSFCSGLLDSSWEPDDTEKELGYLLSPHVIHRYAQLCTIYPHTTDPLQAIHVEQDIRKLLRLFDLRQLDPVWPSIAQDLVALTRNPQLYRISPWDSHHDDYKTWRQHRHNSALKAITRLVDAVCQCHPGLEGPQVYEFVHGRDLEDLRDEALNIDILPVYAPYVIPFALDESLSQSFVTAPDKQWQTTTPSALFSPERSGILVRMKNFFPWNVHFGQSTADRRD